MSAREAVQAWMAAREWCEQYGMDGDRAPVASLSAAFEKYAAEAVAAETKRCWKMIADSYQNEKLDDQFIRDRAR